MFGGFYAVLWQNQFCCNLRCFVAKHVCPDLRTFYAEKNCAQNFVRVRKMTNIMYVFNYESIEKHFPWNIIWRPMAIFFAILEMPCNQIASFLLRLHMAYRIAQCKIQNAQIHKYTNTATNTATAHSIPSCTLQNTECTLGTAFL